MSGGRWPGIGVPWSGGAGVQMTGLDIGGPSPAGSNSYSSGTFTVSAGGADVYGVTDQFRFVYQPLNGNGTIVARVASITVTDPWAKGGVMIRESLDANSIHAMVIVSASSGAAFQRRTTTGGSSEGITDTGAAPYWVKLVRSGNNFTPYKSSDGTNWAQLDSITPISMATSVYVGLMLTSHNDGVLCTATFDNVSIT